MGNVEVSRAWPLATRRADGFGLFDWGFVILGGLPLFLPLIFWVGENGGPQRVDMALWYYWVNAAISGPHVYSTYLRLGRKIGEGQVSRFLGWPAYLVSVVVLYISHLTGHLAEAMTAVNVWQSYHYLRQTYGVYCFYAPGDHQERRLAFWAFHGAMPLLIFGRWDTIHTAWQGKAQPYLIPMDIPDVFMRGCWMAFWISVGLGVLLMFVRASRGTASGLWKGFGVLVAYYAVHAYGFLSVDHFQRGFFAVTIFHAVQYLGLTWKLENANSPAGQRAPTRWLRQSPFLIFWAVLLGLGLVWENFTLLVPAAAVFLLSAVSFHHYWVDAVIWRRKVGA